MSARLAATTVPDLLAFLGDREERKVGHNTWAVRLSDGGVAVVLHRTPILTFAADGWAVIRTGGYRTVTTKARLNAFLQPLGYRVNQEAWTWFLDGPEGRSWLPEGAQVPWSREAVEVAA